MPIETKRQAEVLKKLQDVIKHTDRDIAAGRKLAIKRWVETYIEYIKLLRMISWNSYIMFFEMKVVG